MSARPLTPGVASDASRGVFASLATVKRAAPKDCGYIGAVVKRVLLAAPRGYCAGVERAVETVERALAQHGAPVYVRKQIVHNSHVVDELSAGGAVFVTSVEDVPPGGLVVFSAHGIAPAVRAGAATRSLRTIDATCPLVTKVHAEAKRYAAEGYTVVLVGHAGHEEVEGTMGEAPEAIVLVESVTDAERLEVEDPLRVAYVTQTTLSVDETREIITVLRRRFPALRGPEKEDICYATTNRQQAVKELIPHVQLLLVLGSANSSNSQRLVEVARTGGVPAHLIESRCELDERWLEGVETVGVTSGASAPEVLVEGLCNWFRGRGVTDIRELSPAEENVVFKLPAELRRPSAA
jgi:4-hydroxy-3-methylbut-2-enyl diphosphate reductase